MKTERVELAALARAAGPQLNQQEAATAAYLAEFVEACRQVAATPQDVRMERGLIWCALDKLVGELGLIKKCMNGGRMPANKGVIH